jgi:hypothetical protein
VEGWLASRLTEIGKALFYKERSWEAIFRLAGAGGLPPQLLADFVAWLRRRRVGQKRIDALAMVAAIRAHLAAGVLPLTVSYRFQDTGYHRAAAQQAMVSRGAWCATTLKETSINRHPYDKIAGYPVGQNGAPRPSDRRPVPGYFPVMKIFAGFRRAKFPACDVGDQRYRVI